ncbi:hypothetical protein [Streptacidiphilus anmyonensis]|uniref:hypothetical protein n=1 Tax=Streptacidiphilus anmyonensis TaxID=405782 RepID=UPI000B274C34|nr:hypothetical protein [Streptacidiphilus anmyonensis]
MGDSDYYSEYDRRRGEAGDVYRKADLRRNEAYEQRRREQEQRDRELWAEWSAQQSGS